MKVRKPLDDMKDIKEMGFGALLHFGAPNSIEREEAAGQAYLVQEEMLPKEIQSPDTLEQFIKLGFEFGEVIDDLFVSAKLPPGWSKSRTDHSMWTGIVDEQGRKRVSIFYKAAFYDKSAFMRLNRRLSPSKRYVNYPDGKWPKTQELIDSEQQVGIVLDGDKEIWVSSPLTPNEDQPSYKLSDRCYKIATEWLNTMYPGWDDNMAYWDEEI